MWRKFWKPDKLIVESLNARLTWREAALKLHLNIPGVGGRGVHVNYTMFTWFSVVGECTWAWETGCSSWEVVDRGVREVHELTGLRLSTEKLPGGRRMTMCCIVSIYSWTQEFLELWCRSSGAFILDGRKCRDCQVYLTDFPSLSNGKGKCLLCVTPALVSLY